MTQVGAVPVDQERPFRLQVAEVASQLVRELDLQVGSLVLVVGELDGGQPLLLRLLSLLLLPRGCGGLQLVQLFLEGPVKKRGIGTVSNGR